MKKFVAGVGESDFRSLREGGCDFVDKSFFIQDVLRDSTKVLLFPRPRRFGKTTNLSMLEHFLRKTDENLLHIFDGLMVTRDAEAMKHFQKYPVISISFKDVKGQTLSQIMAGIREQIVAACRQHTYLVDDGKIDVHLAEDLRRVISRSATDDELANSFKWLSTALHQYHGQRVVILIDEYDTPIHTAYVNDYFEDVVTFFRTFFSTCLKDNVALFKGVLTGILRVSKENMFSDLNHILVHSILTPGYATAFGFTEDEVAAIIEPSHLEEVRAWYNGYAFGGHVIYNPWSILNYIQEGRLEPYWVNTGGTSLIERLAFKQGLALSDVSTKLINGGTIDQIIDSNIVLRDIDSIPDAFWNFLLFAGYLKPVELNLVMGRYHAKLAIPNEEVRIVYQDLFRVWLHRIDPRSDDTTVLVKALLSNDAATVEERLQSILMRAMSYLDAGAKEPEALYHGFVLGLLVHLENQYEVRSNRESGYGRVDLWMRPKTPGRPGVVIEFKVKDVDKPERAALEEAAMQVREKHYTADLLAAGISPVYEYAIAFDGKKAFVRTVDDVLKKRSKTATKKQATTKKRATTRKSAAGSKKPRA